MGSKNETLMKGATASDDDDLVADLKARLRQAEQELRESREMMDLAASSANLGWWSRDLASDKLSCSSGFLANLGLSPETKLTYSQLRSMRHPDDAAEVERLTDAALENGNDYEAAYRVTRPDGDVRRINVKGHAVFENGKAIRLIGITQDVTDANRALEAVHEAQDYQKFVLRLNDTFRDLENPFAIMDTATEALGLFLKANTVGYGEIDAGGVNLQVREWSERSPAIDSKSVALEKLGNALNEAMLTGQVIVIADIAGDPRLDPNARGFFSDMGAGAAILVPLLKADHLEGLFYVTNRTNEICAKQAALAEDLAERTWNAVNRAQAEINLRESETRQRIIAETLPALVWIINSDLKLVYANARWTAFSGLAEEDALGYSWMEVMHPDDVNRVVKDIEEWRKTESAFAIELRYRNRDGVYRWHMVRAEPIHDAKGAFRGWSGTSTDIHDLKETEEALRRNSTQLQIALQAAHMGVWYWDTQTGNLDLSDRAVEIFGADRAQVKSWPDLRSKVDQNDAERSDNAMRHSLNTGDVYDLEYRVYTKPGAPVTWVAAQGQVTYDSDGSISGMIGVVQDITERKFAEERQNLLIRELHHRVKNTLATVQAIVGSTARTASSIEEFYQAFVGRIVSLARTHNLLTEDLWQKASLSELVRTELGPYDDDHRNRIVIEGPDLELPSEAAVPIGMAIHELTTNAAKHGALSTFGGQVDVKWQLEETDGKPILNFTWTEHGGPRVMTPTRQGFGSRLLQRVLATQLQADVHMDFAAEGLRFTMALPVPGDPPLFNPDH